MASIDADVVKHALTVARDYGFAEVELVNGEARFVASLEPAPRKKKQLAQPLSGAEAQDGACELLAIKANHVGYLRTEGGKLQVGHRVEKGDTVASIATLGLANDVESAVAGEVVEVFVKDGDPVQFGQVLAQVKP